MRAAELPVPESNDLHTQRAVLNAAIARYRMPTRPDVAPEASPTDLASLLGIPRCLRLRRDDDRERSVDEIRSHSRG
jgi:hypothetical protein